MIYYNEFDPFVAEWLVQLIRRGHLPAGEVDTRDIKEVKPDEIKSFKQCHFFAGIGGWAYALSIANWGDSPVWTGSCPCQPFSAAGKRKGKTDDRHLWPTWFNLIKECKPPTIFGEQVATAITHQWWDEVASDLEREGYATGAVVLPACSVGKPHKRDRLWFVGNSQYNGQFGEPESRRNGTTISNNAQGESGSSKFKGASKSYYVPQGSLGDSDEQGLQGRLIHPECAGEQPSGETGLGWVICPDGKRRIIEPSICLLANGVSNRVGKLRGYGNAIVPEVAAEFIKGCMEILI